MTTSALGPKPDRHRWGFYAVVMAVCLLLSMAGNGLHVWSQWHTDVAAGVDRGTASPWVPTIAVMVFPAMVMVMTEMVVISHRRNAGRVRTVVTALAALVGLVTLAVSYVGLVYVCTTIIGIPGFLGYLAPIVVDAPIIAATVGLWDVLGNIRADAVDHVHTAPAPPAHAAPARVGWEPSHAVHDEVAQSVHDEVARGVQQPVPAPATPVHSVAQHDDLDRAQLAVHEQADSTAHRVHSPDLREHDDEAVHADPMHALDDNPLERAGEPVHADDHDVHDGVAEPVREPVHTADDAVHDEVAQRARPVFTVVGDDVHGDFAHADEGGVHALAARVHAELNPSVDVDVLARLIGARRDSAASYRDLSEAAGVSPNTVRKWIKAAEDLVGEEVTA
ncbi:hypothetical protein [Gordonia alkaliphila]|uniref:DUF2637 domain-containing protein n=1 Tax=Gordonia alkaliphila TaxID=1053547 RepID=A0ABP8Z4P3_9ACTN